MYILVQYLCLSIVNSNEKFSLSLFLHNIDLLEIIYIALYIFLFSVYVCLSFFATQILVFSFFFLMKIGFQWYIFLYLYSWSVFIFAKFQYFLTFIYSWHRNNRCKLKPVAARVFTLRHVEVNLTLLFFFWLTLYWPNLIRSAIHGLTWQYV